MEGLANLDRDQIHQFLADLRTHIANATRDGNRVRDTVKNTAKTSNGGTGWEAAFIDEFVLRNVHSYISQHQKEVLRGEPAHKFILAESKWAKSKNVNIACGTPVKNSGHPFYKILGTRPERLYHRWSERDPRGRKTSFAAVCPDFALVSPYRVVFECKYFNQPAVSPATSQLVDGLYQAFFYGAMPTLPPGRDLKHGWDYEYSCFLAYDATPNGRMARAWEALEKIHQRFWDESNIFVIILTSETM
jgi:hypothetical protein